MSKTAHAEDRRRSRSERLKAPRAFLGARERPRAALLGLDPELFNHIPDGVCVVGPDNKVRHGNVALSRLLKRPICEIIGRSHEEIFHPLIDEDVDCPIHRMEETRQHQTGRIRVNGHWYQILANPIFDSRGRSAGAIHIFSDITDLQRAEEALIRTNQVLKILHLCDQALVRSTDESSLLAEVCRIIVDKGGFGSAWIGLLGDDGTGDLWEAARSGSVGTRPGPPAASSADQGDMEEMARGVLETGRPVVLRSLEPSPVYQSDPDGPAPSAGASIVLPMNVAGRTIGAMVVSTAQVDDFAGREVLMLTDLAADLAFGVESIRTRERREQAVLDLVESEERYAMLIENSQDGIIVAQDAKLVFTNSRATAMTGWSADELVGASIPDLVAPEHVGKVAGIYRARLAGENPAASYEVDLITRDGRRLPVELRSSIVAFQGRPATMAFVRDISERRAADHKLRESEVRYRTTLDGMFEGCQILGFDWRYVYVNDAACGHARKRPDELLGRTIMEVYPGIEATPLFARMQACMEDRVPARLENEFTYTDGSSAWFSLSIQPVPEGLFVLSLDISERKKMDRELEERADQLREAYLRLRDVQEGTIGAIATMAELRDPYTSGHQRRVTRVACAIAQEMGIPEDRIAGLATAGLLHDIGKIQIPSDILSKPGRLSVVELEMIKSHSRAGYQILRAIPFPWPVADIIVQHHERMDGSGYPAGLAGDEILLEARILGVADVLEAMASHRPYRAALGVPAALDELSRNAGRLYDAEVVAACVRVFDRGFDLDKERD